MSLDNLSILVRSAIVLSYFVIVGCGSNTHDDPTKTTGSGKPVPTQVVPPPSDGDQCLRGDPKACQRAASTSLDAKNDEGEINAAKYLDKGCTLKDLDACFLLGRLWEDGGVRVKSLEKALAIFDRACADGFDQACMHLGVIYVEGKEVPVDKRKGMGYDDRACTRSAASAACVVLGWWLISGQDGAPKDPKRGLALLETGVAAGNANAKQMLAYALSEDGISAPKNIHRALALFEEACAASIGPSCLAAGDFYHRGLGGVAVDAKKAAGLFERACNLKADEGCKAATALANEEAMASAVDVRAIWKAYNENEVAADNEFKGKRLMIWGVVQSVDKDIAGTAVVQLVSPNEYAPVGVYVKDDQLSAVAKLRKEDTIHATCTCAGKSVMSPVLQECEVVDVRH